MVLYLYVNSIQSYWYRYCYLWYQGVIQYQYVR